MSILVVAAAVVVGHFIYLFIYLFTYIFICFHSIQCWCQVKCTIRRTIARGAIVHFCASLLHATWPIYISFAIELSNSHLQSILHVHIVLFPYWIYRAINLILNRWRLFDIDWFIQDCCQNNCFTHWNTPKTLITFIHWWWWLPIYVSAVLNDSGCWQFNRFSFSLFSSIQLWEWNLLPLLLTLLNARATCMNDLTLTVACVIQSFH